MRERTELMKVCSARVVTAVSIFAVHNSLFTHFTFHFIYAVRSRSQAGYSAAVMSKWRRQSC